MLLAFKDKNIRKYCSGLKQCFIYCCLTISGKEFYSVYFGFISGDSCNQFENSKQAERIIKVRTLPFGILCQSRSILNLNPGSAPLIRGAVAVQIQPCSLFDSTFCNELCSSTAQNQQAQDFCGGWKANAPYICNVVSSRGMGSRILCFFKNPIQTSTTCRDVSSNLHGIQLYFPSRCLPSSYLTFTHSSLTLQYSCFGILARPLEK